jgi:hypothetical protein
VGKRRNKGCSLFSAAVNTRQLWTSVAQTPAQIFPNRVKRFESLPEKAYNAAFFVKATVLF